MRRAAPLILLAFVAIVASVGRIYYLRLKAQAAVAPAKLKRLSPGTSATFRGWTYSHTSSEKTVITMHSDDFQELDGKDELTGVTLDVFNKDGDTYNHVQCAKAEFDVNRGILYSEGEVQITMKVPEHGGPSGKLMKIVSTGVSVESKTGKSYTDRLVSFKFDRGYGQAMGADYDPNTRILNLHNDVNMTWTGADPGGTPMKIETAQVNYNEHDAKIYLTPWAKLTRDTMSMNAGPATVTIDHGNLKMVETTQARGTDQRPGRNLEYAANQLTVEFNDQNQIQKITGVDQARVVNHGETSETTLTGDRVVMDFETTDSDSLLSAAVAQGHGTMENKPVMRPGVDPSDTRILRSDTIHTKMRPGGREIEAVETDGPGAIEFIPNAPEKPHRWMNGGHIWMTYGPNNTIQSFRTIAATTRTEKPKAKDAKEAPAPSLTWSKNLMATFRPNSSQLDKLDQSGDFRYEEGDRRASADRALLDQPNNIITLLGSARMSDSTGSADADKIVLCQTTGDFTAEGHVTSTRMPDKKKDDSQGGGMLDEDKPLHARAQRMVSSNNHLDIRYQGGAVLWQGADRLEADSVEIDRDNDILKAHGHVLSQLQDKVKDDDAAKDDSAAGKSDAKPAPAKPVPTTSAKSNGKPPADPASKDETKARLHVFTIVKAPDMDYNDDTRLAHYSGGATLERDNMVVNGRDLHAYLRNDSNDSSLDHAVADGHVTVHEIGSDRTRDAFSEHAEYYVDESKVILEGGDPRFVDSTKGTTKGQKLTWYSKDDRLVVNGVPQEPVKSLLHKKTIAR
jgi:lipopolysaccharide export system protein LptA